jgi:hypothetical protein
MIIEPVVTDWASEGQVLDITVHKMFDVNNMQQSPILGQLM